MPTATECTRKSTRSTRRNTRRNTTRKRRLGPRSRLLPSPSSNSKSSWAGRSWAPKGEAKRAEVLLGGLQEQVEIEAETGCAFQKTENGRCDFRAQVKAARTQEGVGKAGCTEQEETIAQLTEWLLLRSVPTFTVIPEGPRSPSPLMVVDNEEEPVEGVPLEQYRAWLGEKGLEVGKLGFSLYLVKGRGFVLRKVRILRVPVLTWPN